MSGITRLKRIVVEKRVKSSLSGESEPPFNESAFVYLVGADSEGQTKTMSLVLSNSDRLALIECLAELPEITEENAGSLEFNLPNSSVKRNME